MTEVYDSEDELLLNALGASTTNDSDIGCWSCDAPHASVYCSMCGVAVYCDASCLRQNFSSHRRSCIASVAGNISDDDDSEENLYSEDDDESVESDQSEEDVVVSRKVLSRKKSSKSRKSQLTEAQVQNLLQLSQSSHASKSHASQEQAIRKLQEEFQLLSQRTSTSIPGPDPLKKSKTITPSGLRTSSRDIQDLQLKLRRLENLSRQHQPLKVRDDPAYAKYIHLRESVPVDQIQKRMKADGLDPSLLLTPDALLHYHPLQCHEDPKLRKYFKLVRLKMNREQIQMKMEAEGVDPALLDTPEATSPNDPGPMISSSSSRGGSPLLPTTTTVVPLSTTTVRIDDPSSTGGRSSPTPLTMAQDPAYDKYFKLLKMGLGKDQVQLKMTRDGVDPALLDTPDARSPNDASTRGQNPGTLNISIEQVYAMVLEHQARFASSSGHSSTTGRGGGHHHHHHGGGAIQDPQQPPQPPLSSSSVEDQMARELAEAEGAVESIFGVESESSSSSASSSSGGGPLTMVQQLEKQARKKQNLVLVANVAKINTMCCEVVSKDFGSDVELAMHDYREWSSQLEQCGLPLGSSACQTWSRRLLIQKKTTSSDGSRTWYFNPLEREVAGRAYQRLWSLASLTGMMDQLVSKQRQLEQAPENLKTQALGPMDVIDRYTDLLKEMVKLKHKIFKGQQFQLEVGVF